jgi:hypothetical protein
LFNTETHLLKTNEVKETIQHNFCATSLFRSMPLFRTLFKILMILIFFSAFKVEIKICYGAETDITSMMIMEKHFSQQKVYSYFINDLPPFAGFNSQRPITLNIVQDNAVDVDPYVFGTP